MADAPELKDLRLEVRCKPVSGKTDEACGLVFRYRDPDDYYVARANALEDNVNLYHVVKGRRRQIKGWSGKVAANAWHALAIEARGDRLQVFWEGKPIIDARDDTFSDAGKVGRLDQGRLRHLLRRADRDAAGLRRSKAMRDEATGEARQDAAFAGRHEPRPLPFDPAKLRGLSERLVRSHWENNYCGAVKALNAVEQRLAAMLEDPDLPPFVYGDLKREELLRTGSVRLHELYFGNLGGDGRPGDAIERILSRVVRLLLALGGRVPPDRERPRRRLGLDDPRGRVPTACFTTTGPGITRAARPGAVRCSSSTCTSTRTTSTSVRPRPGTWTRSCRTSTGKR